MTISNPQLAVDGGSAVTHFSNSARVRPHKAHTTFAIRLLAFPNSRIQKFLDMLHFKREIGIPT